MNLIFITMDGARKDRTLAAKNYSNRLSHGEAVLMGMMSACQFSHQKKM